MNTPHNAIDVVKINPGRGHWDSMYWVIRPTPSDKVSPSEYLLRAVNGTERFPLYKAHTHKTPDTRNLWLEAMRERANSIGKSVKR